MTVRPATAADAEAIAAIYAHYVATTAVTFDESAPGADEIAANIARITSAGLPFLVAEAEGRVGGYGYLSPYKGRSAYRYTVENSVYVDPGARGRGIGRALLERLGRLRAVGFKHGRWHDTVLMQRSLARG